MIRTPRTRAASAPASQSSPAVFAERSAGVLLPLASLPGRHGVGSLGAPAESFVQWLASAGAGWWQMLPIGPLGEGDSPYSSTSSFAIEPGYLCLDRLVERGLLERRDVAAPKALGSGPAQFATAAKLKQPLFALAHERWRRRRGASTAAYRGFREREGDWLDDWLRFSTGAIDGSQADIAAFVQFELDRQWRELRAAARKSAVRLMGDLPIFVGAESSDVSGRPDLFRLDAQGAPRLLSGSPPDSYSDDGQLWGHPHYRWSRHGAENYDWWRRRFGSLLARFDALRVDHFIGFHHAWEVPASARTARHGKWGRTPGKAILQHVLDDRGELPLVAEDLGVVTPPVRALRDHFGLPGMRILQNGFGGPGDYDRPHAYPANSVAYTGTHDNDTLVGSWRKLRGDARQRALAYLGLPQRTPVGEQVHWRLIAALAASPANTVIAPLQDLLGLGSDARLNTPGVPRGNWRWRVDAAQLNATLARRFQALLDVTSRLSV
ncbi:4-alpha-glucanotransferase [Engelhardtia mirabilis]|uniref:4-alpha-glucanotransferase n=1 Tax=Engelhardtia mirabilis TaxID=2528011 RepID=A0A518BLM1_9BACT|nr:4-alpha-glucanotransferase [Planctomycetes bacterium Pla133]QDV02205.1 4-alpha-glucanotransferase [Planctomycetes bacterium Pla86]